MASTYLTRTPSSASNRKTWTWSGWIKRSTLSSSESLFSAYTDDPNRLRIAFNGSDQLIVFGKDGGTTNINLTSTQVFRDPSAWYNIVVTFDTTQATASDRIKVYVNNTQITSFTSLTYPSQNYDTFINNTTGHYIGQRGDSTEYFDGYMAHVHLTDVTAYAASTFGSTATNGQWVPNLAPSVTYGTNGYFLKFTNASDLGEDFSGNNNDYTKSGSGDKVLDNPENVFASLNPLYKQGSPTFSEGNTKVVLPAGDGTQGAAANLAPPAGQWYWEIKQGSSTNSSIMVREASDKEDDLSYYQGSYAGYELNDGNQRVTGNTESTYGAAYAANDIIMVALDMDNNRVYFGKNGLWADGNGNSNQSSLNDFVPLNGVTNGVPAVTNANGSASATFQFNFGNPAYAITSGNADENGYGNFEYAPPTGYLALCTENLATELTQPIGKGGSYMNTVLYTGNGANQSITGVGFQPDLVWLKSRGNTESHWWGDSNRGIYLRLSSNNETAEFNTGPSGNDYPGVSSFDSDGFGVGRSDAANGSGNNMVAWNWRAGGSNVTNNNGSITSTVNANTTSGFSVVTCAIPGSSVYTIGHGLTQAPEFIITKGRASTSAWWAFYIADDGSLDYVNFSGTGAGASDTAGLSLPTSTVFSMVSNYTLQQTIVNYCYHSVEGYSKIGKYTGNGSTDGAFVYTGFRPSYFMTKPISTTGEWTIYDKTRDTFNVADHRLAANDNASEYNNGNGLIDFLSNGFKMRINHPSNNSSGFRYLYLAFAKNPFTDSSGVPTTAR